MFGPFLLDPKDQLTFRYSLDYCEPRPKGLRIIGRKLFNIALATLATFSIVGAAGCALHLTLFR